MSGESDKIKVLQGRVNALEGLVMTMTGIILARTGNDPDNTRTIALLNFVRQAVRDLPAAQECPQETDDALDDLLSTVSENLNLLRP